MHRATIMTISLYDATVTNYHQTQNSTAAMLDKGKAFCEEFFKAGVKSLVCVDMNIEGAEHTARSVNGIAVSADVSKEDDIVNVIKKADEYSGGIDIFCSNAGIGGKPGRFETDASDWEMIWGVNVQSHIFAAKHVLPQMIERGEGYLMNTSSAAGLLTQLGAAGYAVTKSAAVSFAEWVKITYGGKGIGVSCLCPQAVRTAMTADGCLLMRKENSTSSKLIVDELVLRSGRHDLKP